MVEREDTSLCLPQLGYLPDTCGEPLTIRQLGGTPGQPGRMWELGVASAGEDVEARGDLHT